MTTMTPGDGLDRHPAQDIDAEQVTLGCMLCWPGSVPDVMEVIGAADFYRPAHATIFEALRDLFARGAPTEAVAVNKHLSETGQSAKTGGGDYLHTLVTMATASAQATYYAGIVAEHAMHRRVTEAGHRIARLGETPGIPAADLATQALAIVWNLTEGRGHNAAVPLAELTPQALDQVEAAAGRNPGHGAILTGFADLDELLHGLGGGQMIIIAARPAVGKSLLSTDIARSCAIRQGKTCLLFSLEMGRLEVTTRIISAASRVNIHAMRGAWPLADEDWERIRLHLPDLLAAPLWIDDTAMITIADIRARAHRMKAARGLDLLIVDYLQLMSSAGRRPDNRQQEVSEISRQLKVLAKELDIPVVALSQLNRGPEQRHDKKPMLSDLRESGSLEQDADVVILLHREDFYEKETPRAGEADFIVAKNRGGPTATVTTAFQGHYSRFVDMAPASAAAAVGSHVS